MNLIEPEVISDTSTFSRSSTASYYTVDGRVGIAPVDAPRLNYPPEKRVYAPAGWLAGPSLLLPTIPLPGMTIIPAAVPQFLAEPAASNVMLQSQDLTTWTANEVTVTANGNVAPDGTMTAERIVPTSTNTADHSITKMGSAAVVAAGGMVGASIFLRAGGYAFARLRCAISGGAAGFEMVVDLATGDIPSAGPFGAGASLSHARILVLAGGWYRLEIEGAVASATTFGLTLVVGAGASYPGDTIAGIEAWGADLKAGPVTSYVPTTTTAVIRAADVGTPMMVSSVAENEPVYNAATAYAQNATVRGTGADAHSLFVSLVAGNTGNALSDQTKWLPAGSTNRWRMFDQVVGSQTIDTDSISVVTTSPKRLTALAMMNIDAASLRVTVTDPADGVVYDKTISLISTNGINNWWKWLFADIERATQKVLLDLPPYAGVQITITLSNPGNTVRCGACVPGRLKVIGATQYGATAGIVSYSTKDRDKFGNAIIKKRPFSRRTGLDVLVPNNTVDQLVDDLAKYDATAIVFIGSELFGATVIYGFYKDFSVVIKFTEDSLLNLELESLV